MERNWLIRTTQNQVLGPVTKQKILEFIQKGALGLSDEVCSGNGYWFHLREKDLVEKYLHGDIPQGYNPISESRSVLSKRENPDKTSSINTAPANKSEIASSSLTSGIVPKSEDLDFPDITIVGQVASKELETKLPDLSDLEFPDVKLITESVKANPSIIYATEPKTSPNIVVPKPKAEPASNFNSSIEGEEVNFPKADDLEFPDLDNMKTSPKIEKGKVDLSHQHTRTVALDMQQMEEVLPENQNTTDETKTTATEENSDKDFEFSVDVKQIGNKFISQNDSDEHTVQLQDLQAIEDLEVAAQAPLQVKGKFSSAKEMASSYVKKEKGPKLEDRKLLHERKAKTVENQPIRKLINEPILTNPGNADTSMGSLKKRNDNYLFFILIIIVLIIIAVFFYFKEILNKPLPV